MSIDITAHVRVHRDPAAVAAYMTDPANDPEWIGGLREAELLGDGPVTVGSRVRRVAYFLRRRIEYVNEILALDEHQLDMQSVKAPFPMRITYRFDPAPEGRHGGQQPRARRRPADPRPARAPQRAARPRAAARRARALRTPDTARRAEY